MERAPAGDMESRRGGAAYHRSFSIFHSFAPRGPGSLHAWNLDNSSAWLEPSGSNGSYSRRLALLPLSLHCPVSSHQQAPNLTASFPTPTPRSRSARHGTLEPPSLPIPAPRLPAPNTEKMMAVRPPSPQVTAGSSRTVPNTRPHLPSAACAINLGNGYISPVAPRPVPPSLCLSAPGPCLVWNAARHPDHSSRRRIPDSKWRTSHAWDSRMLRLGGILSAKGQPCSSSLTLKSPRRLPGFTLSLLGCSGVGQTNTCTLRRRRRQKPPPQQPTPPPCPPLVLVGRQNARWRGSYDAAAAV